MIRRRNIVGVDAMDFVAVAEVFAATPITAADNASIDSAPIGGRARRGSLVVDGGRARIIAAEKIGRLHEPPRLLEGSAEEARRAGGRSDFCESHLAVGCP